MSTAKKIVAAQKSRECTCDHDWPIINWYNIQEKTLQSQHLHETWRQLSCNRFLALLHDAIMSHCELWVDLNLRMGDCFLHSHVITWTLFLAQRETVVDLTGPGWVVGIWLNDKRRKDLYIYIYICRERKITSRWVMSRGGGYYSYWRR